MSSTIPYTAHAHEIDTRTAYQEYNAGYAQWFDCLRDGDPLNDGEYSSLTPDELAGWYDAIDDYRAQRDSLNR